MIQVNVSEPVGSQIAFVKSLRRKHRMPNVLTQPAAVFTPEAVASINRAYAVAIDIVGAEGALEQTRHKLAEHMMFLARNGEMDEDRLCYLSVIAVLGRPPASRSPVRSDAVANRG